MTEITRYYSFFGQWAALSQYGYVMDWFKTESEAIAYTVCYYLNHPELCD